VASQVQISSYQAICGGASSEALAATRRVAPNSREHLAEAGLPAIIAHSFEFVALPGRAEGIQSEIPMATRHAFRGTDGFMGSMVLVSEQEARLVTVVTLWTGSNRAELCSESEKCLQRWLAPYVDRWLRTRRFASFVSAPDRFLANPHSLPELPVQSASTPLQ
jgi:hypothetical protein